MEGEGKNLLKAWMKALACILYAYFFISKLPTSKIRLLFLLPIFYFFVTLPLSLSSPTIAGNTSFFITWLGSFKLLLFCFDAGPLSYPENQLTKKAISQSTDTSTLKRSRILKNTPHRISLIKFIFIAAFPIKIKQIQRHPYGQNHQNQTPKKTFRVSLWLKGLVYSVLVLASILWEKNKKNDEEIPKSVMVLYCCLTYLNLEVVLGVCNKVVGVILGVELDPPFDEPYLSTSLQDFWGRRWNLMVSDVLRHTIYLPVKSVSSTLLGKSTASLPGVMAAFVVSGLMHELIFFYITQASPTWEVTWFFVLHGVCLIVEIIVKRVMGQKWQLSRIISGSLTIGFVMISGFWLFFPPLLRNHVDTRSLDDVKAIGGFTEGLFE